MRRHCGSRVLFLYSKEMILLRFTTSIVDMKNRVIDINHQLQTTSWGEYIIEPTKTNAGTRKLPMTDDVFQMFQAIIDDRPTDLPEIMVQGYCGFLFRDKNGMPEVAHALGTQIFQKKASQWRIF